MTDQIYIRNTSTVPVGIAQAGRVYTRLAPGDGCYFDTKFSLGVDGLVPSVQDDRKAVRLAEARAKDAEARVERLQIRLEELQMRLEGVQGLRAQETIQQAREQTLRNESTLDLMDRLEVAREENTALREHVERLEFENVQRKDRNAELETALQLMMSLEKLADERMSKLEKRVDELPTVCVEETIKTIANNMRRNGSVK